MSNQAGEPMSVGGAAVPAGTCPAALPTTSRDLIPGDTCSRYPDSLNLPDYLREMLEDDPYLAVDLVNMFLSDTASTLDSLDAAAGAADAVRVCQILHRLKGSCSQMGALGIAGICAELEPGAAAGDLTECRLHLPRIRYAFTVVTPLLEALIPAQREIG